MYVNGLALAVIAVAIALPHLGHHEVHGEEVRGEEVRGEEVRGEEVRGEEVRGEEVRGEEVRGEAKDPNVAGQKADTEIAQPPAALQDAEAKQDPVEPIDEDMLPDIGEDIQLGPDGEPLPDDQLGGDADPVTRIAEKMRRVEELLRKEAQQTDPNAEPLQQQIVQELDELIKALQEKSQQQPPSGKSSSSPQQNSRSKIKQPSQRPKQPSNKRDGNSNKPSRDSSERLGKAAPKVDLAEMAELIKDIWGHLPEKDRERLRQSSAEEVMPGHDVAVEKYFRRLAEETND